MTPKYFTQGNIHGRVLAKYCARRGTSIVWYHSYNVLISNSRIKGRNEEHTHVHCELACFRHARHSEPNRAYQYGLLGAIPIM